MPFSRKVLLALTIVLVSFVVIVVGTLLAPLFL
jgi:hypothetical protein